VDGRQVTAVFPDSRRAAAARDRLIAVGVPAANMAVCDATVTKATETASEGRFMGRVVLVVAFWSIFGTVVGAGLGAALSFTIGPSGTSGLIIQMVSWAIFAHLLIGMWAGYVLLADRSGREIGAGHPVILTLCCDTIDESFFAGQLRALGATGVEAGENRAAGQR
jgi:hypothetical protein